MAYRRRDRYWYRSRREGRKVTTDYLGPDLVGWVSAILDAERREELRARRRALRREQLKWKAVVNRADVLRSVIRALVRCELRTAGFRLHKGQWRRERRSL